MNFETTKIDALMTRNVATTTTDCSLRTAAERMTDAKVHCLLVEDAATKEPIGIVSCKDLTQPMFLENQDLLDEMTVEDVMTRPPVAVRASMSVLDAVRLMRMAGVRSVPVMSGEQFVGFVSYTDVLRAVSQGAGDLAPQA